MKKAISFLTAVMLCGTMFVGCGSSGSSSSEQSGPVVSESGITLSYDNGKVLDVKMGMTYDEVIALIGEPVQKVPTTDGDKATWLFSNVASFEKIDPGVCDEEYVTDDYIFFVKGQRYCLEMFFSVSGEDKGKLNRYECNFERTDNKSSWIEFEAWIKEKLSIDVELEEDQFSENIEALNGRVLLQSYEEDGKLCGRFSVQKDRDLLFRHGF